MINGIIEAWETSRGHSGCIGSHRIHHRFCGCGLRSVVFPGMAGHAPVELGGCESVRRSCADLLAVLRSGVAVSSAL